MTSTVDADPYPWPYDGVDRPGPHGAGLHRLADRLLRPRRLRRRHGLRPQPHPRRPRAHHQGARRRCATLGWTVIHTREGHRPDLSDCPPNKLWRSQRIGAGIGDAGPVRAHPRARRARLGHRPRGRAARRRARSSTSRARARSTPPTSTCCCAPRGITHLVFTGITTDVCVHTTMRDANDRGYECLLLDRLHRRHRRRQLRGRAEDGHHAGRRVRRGGHLGAPCWRRSAHDPSPGQHRPHIVRRRPRGRPHHTARLPARSTRPSTSSCPARRRPPPSPIRPIRPSPRTGPVQHAADDMARRADHQPRAGRAVLRRHRRARRRARGDGRPRPRGRPRRRRRPRRRAPRAATLRSRLHGIPITVKDVIDVAGLTTRAGSLTYARPARARRRGGGPAARGPAW